MKIERREVSFVSIANIPFVGAERPIDAGTVKKLARDLADMLERGSPLDTGFSNPIELAELPEDQQPRPGDLYRIVAGFHRFEAWRQAKGMRKGGMPDFDSLVCTVYIDATPEQLRYIHLRENLSRKDLTPNERKIWATEFSALKMFGGTSVAEVAEKAVSTDRTNSSVSTDRTNSHKPKGGPKADPWFTDFQKDNKLAKQTAVDWWNDFREYHKLSIPAGKASREQQASFLAWTNGKAKRDAEAAEKAAEAARTAERKREEARQQSLLEAGLQSDFARYTVMVGSAAASAFALKLHDNACAYVPDQPTQGAEVIDLAASRH